MNDNAPPTSMSPAQIIAALREPGYDAVLDNSNVVPLSEWSVPRKAELRLIGSTIRDSYPRPATQAPVVAGNPPGLLLPA